MARFSSLPRLVLCFSFSVAPLGCSSTDGEGSGTGAGGTTHLSPVPSPVNDANAASGGGTASGGSSGAGASLGCPAIPTDVSISKIALYQPLEVVLYESGQVVAPQARVSDIVQGKSSTLRVFVEPKQGFQPRELQLHLSYVSAEHQQASSKAQVISAASSQSDLSSTFVVDVDASSLGVGTQLTVGLGDCALDQGSSDAGASANSDIVLDLAPRDNGPIELVFVPIRHDGRLPDTSDATLSKYVERANVLYPTTGLNYSVHAPIDSEQTGVPVSFTPLLNKLQSLHYAEKPGPAVYYYGLITPADSLDLACGSGCSSGSGHVAYDDYTEEEGAYRVAAGLAYDDERAFKTFVHELGHNHGRTHVNCPNITPSNPDPNYPYADHANGSLGVWSYDSTKHALVAPDSTYDMMTYCSPAGVSDYTYRALLERVVVMNHSALAYVLGNTSEEWNSVLVTSHGVRWGENVGVDLRSARRAKSAYAYDAHGQRVAKIQVQLASLSDDSEYIVLVPKRASSSWYGVAVPGLFQIEYPQ